MPFSDIGPKNPLIETPTLVDEVGFSPSSEMGCQMKGQREQRQQMPTPSTADSTLQDSENSTRGEESADAQKAHKCYQSNVNHHHDLETSSGTKIYIAHQEQVQDSMSRYSPDRFLEEAIDTLLYHARARSLGIHIALPLI